VQTDPHTVPQAPQLVGSLVKSNPLSVIPSQSLSTLSQISVIGVTPIMHAWVMPSDWQNIMPKVHVPRLVPHVPVVAPGVQVPVHIPPTHPPMQARPQAPHAFGSVIKSAQPVGHSERLPQIELLGHIPPTPSSARSTQIPLHDVVGGAQPAATHAPA
jgi:hypothetical protein